MSRMSDLNIDIQDMLAKGRSPMDVARELEIPVNWVYEGQEEVAGPDEVLSPFATINS